MKQIVPGIWTWPWFSEEKGYYFNGTLVAAESERVLIDPVRAPLETFEAHGPFKAIYLSNKDHERMAYDLRREIGRAHV